MSDRRGIIIYKGLWLNQPIKKTGQLTNYLPLPNTQTQQTVVLYLLWCYPGVNPLTHGIGQNCLKLKKAYNLTVKFKKKIVKINNSTEIARATIFNFLGTPLKPIISAL